MVIIDEKFLKTDQAESKRVSQIFTNPKLHRFVSEYDQDVWLDARGPRGGKIRGKKTICAHCGHKPEKH